MAKSGNLTDGNLDEAAVLIHMLDEVIPDVSGKSNGHAAVEGTLALDSLYAGLGRIGIADESLELGLSLDYTS